ncbi:MAG TPA: carboxypeptidase-like regulatory domain-containing protein [Trichocoleus sp.]
MKRLTSLMLRPLVLGPLALGSLGALVGVLPAWAHGARLSFQTASSVALVATYDNGEPMKAAQILVYSPDNPSEPWTEGTTDDRGRYAFTPDPAIPGNWEVTVRQAGHGDVVIVPVSGKGAEGGAAVAEGTSSDTSSGPSSGVAGSSARTSIANLPPVQKGVVMGSVIWGFVGTALFFSRGKR